MAANVKLYTKLATEPGAINIEEQVYLGFQAGDLNLYDFSSTENADNLALVSPSARVTPQIS